MIETLVATMIVTVAMMGIVGIFWGVSNLTRQTAMASVSQSLARRGIEEAKNKGFANLSNGTTVLYYDQNGTGGVTTKTNSHRYSVSTVVTTTPDASGDADKALKTVVVTVRRLADNVTLESTGTYLAWGGI